MRISFTDYFISLRQLISDERVSGEQALAAERTHDRLPKIDLNRTLRSLDLANGRLRPQYKLLYAAGHHVVGIDLINRPQPIGSAEIAYRAARWLYRLLIPKDVKRACCPYTGLCGRLGSSAAMAAAVQRAAQ